MSPGECAVLDDDIIDDVQAVDIDVRVGKATNRLPSNPAARLSSSPIPPGARQTTWSASTSVNPSK